MNKGVFFEIGAQWLTLRGLLEPQWKDAVRQGELTEQGLNVPCYVTEWCNEWTGYFVEPLASVMVEMLSWHKPYWDAHYIQCAVAGTDSLQKAEIREFESGECRMAMIPIEKSAFGTDGLRNSKCAGHFYVPTLTLDSLFASLGVQPDILRIDIEGMEVEVLEQYTFNPMPTYVQIDHHWFNKEACWNILSQHGYNIVECGDELHAERDSQ